MTRRNRGRRATSVAGHLCIVRLELDAFVEAGNSNGIGGWRGEPTRSV
jgi:hypothetical protein